MKNSFFILLAGLLFFPLGCNRANVDCNQGNCSRISAKFYSFETFNFGQESQSYWHFVSLDNYREDCIFCFNYGDAVKNYLDTISLKLPVKKISFLKSVVNIHPNDPEQTDFYRLKNDIIVDYLISEQSFGSDTIFVKKITLNHNSRIKTIQLDKFFDSDLVIIP